MSRSKTRLALSAGGVVFRRVDDAPHYLLILDAHHSWGFPKGHLVDGEQPLAAAVREVAEETGLGGLELHGELGVIDWFFRFRGRLIHKYCHFYLFESAAGVPVPQREEGITSCTWYARTDALVKLSYENSRGVLRLAGGIVDQLHRPGSPAPES